MTINNVNNKMANNKLTFGNRFYNDSAQLQRNALKSRAVVAGINDVGWLIMANNNQERWEKARRFAFLLTWSFAVPLVQIPLTNRLAMKSCAKLTKSFWSNNHKLMHISNKDLTSLNKFKKGVKKKSKNYTYSPFEKLHAKLTEKKLKHENLDYKEMVKKAGGYKKLRKKIINAKVGVLASDIIVTALPFGAFGFFNNLRTKKKTGQGGFSAEFKMADKNLVEKRAQHYENTWKGRLAGYTALTLGVAAAVPLAVRKGILIKNPKNLVTKGFRKITDNFDYTDGIYMSKTTMFICATMLGHFGTLLSTRNKSELKDNIIRYIGVDSLFYVGDIIVASFLANITDKLGITNLTKNNDKTSLREKIFPDYKSLNEVREEVSKGKLASKNKGFALFNYWAGMTAVILAIGFGIPKLVNALTRSDVEKAKKDFIQNKTNPSNIEFIKQYIIQKQMLKD